MSVFFNYKSFVITTSLTTILLLLAVKHMPTKELNKKKKFILFNNIHTLKV